MSDGAALDALAAAGSLDCNLEIVESSFATLARLEGVRSVPYSVRLRSNDFLVDASGLSTLEDWLFLNVTGNPVLERVVIGGGDGFEDLLVIDDGVETFELPDATSGGNVGFSGLPRMKTLDAPRLRTVARLVIDGTALDDFLGLQAMGSVTSVLEIRDNPRLSALEIASFIARLESVPPRVNTCSNEDDDPCP